MGDPTHIPGLPQDVGNSTKAGYLPSQDTAGCSQYASITQSYCLANDTFCDSGSSIAVHLSYVQVYGMQAAKFIEEKVTASNATSTTTAGGSATSSPTPKSNDASGSR